jgi:F0F1-type ATP synthase beta subunit
VLDLLCPLRSDGVTGLFGSHGVGRLVVAQELGHNLGATTDGQVLAFFVSNWDVPGTQNLLSQSPEFAVDVRGRVKTAWIISRSAVNLHYGLGANYLDARIFCSPAFAACGLWPAIDPLYCASLALDVSIVGADHLKVASDVIATLRGARKLLNDATFYEYLALGSHADAKARYAEVQKDALSRAHRTDREILLCAERLEWFFTQPFHTTAEHTGKPGVTVPVSATLDGCRRILAGEFDQSGANELMYRGALT